MKNELKSRNKPLSEVESPQLSFRNYRAFKRTLGALLDKYLARLIKVMEIDLTITKENLPYHIPFILYLTFWAVLYIANKQAAARADVDIMRLKREIQYLDEDYRSVEGKIMQKTRRTAIMRQADEQNLGLVPLKQPAKLLIINDDE